MTLQNRVDPFGGIHADASRGTFTGNRGVIHDPDTRTLLKRRWTTKAWIVCTCDFKGRRRDVMGRNGRSGGAGWTELFFLDEVTALAAGHRPCFHCRRVSARAYVSACGPTLGDVRPAVPAIDAVLHSQRRSAPRPRVAREHLVALPEGAMVGFGDTAAYALREGCLLPWSFAGYGAPIALSELRADELLLLTPPLSVAALRQGYRPAWHESATEAAGAP